MVQDPLAQTMSLSVQILLDAGRGLLRLADQPDLD
jgi:hypothetical protein